MNVYRENAAKSQYIASERDNVKKRKLVMSVNRKLAMTTENLNRYNP